MVDHRRHTHEETHKSGTNVTVETFDIEAIGDEIPFYGELSPLESLRVFDLAPRVGIKPRQRVDESNTTCVGLSKAIVRGLNPTDTTAGIAPDYLAVGSGTATASYQDTALTSKHDEITVTEYIPDGGSMQIRTYIPKRAGNDANITEVGLSGPGGLYNHAVLTDPITKSENEVATVTVTLGFSNA